MSDQEHSTSDVHCWSTFYVLFNYFRRSQLTEGGADTIAAIYWYVFLYPFLHLLST